VADNSLLKAVAKKGDLAAQFEILRRVDQVETSGRGAGENILADPHERGALQRGQTILAKPRHMHLHDRAGPAIGRCNRFIAARSHVTINSCFTIAKNGARGIAGRGLHRMFDPAPIAGGDQELGIDAAKRFGVGIVDEGRHVFVREVTSVLALRTQPIR
jgi:hypothetical protein